MVLDHVICQEEPNSRTVGAGTLNRSAVTGGVNSQQGDDVMSEMARRLQERRAKTDQPPSANNNVTWAAVEFFLLWSSVRWQWREYML